VRAPCPTHPHPLTHPHTRTTVTTIIILITLIIVTTALPGRIHPPFVQGIHAPSPPPSPPPHFPLRQNLALLLRLASTPPYSAASAAAASCVNNLVVCNPTGFANLLADGGVKALLELLEVCA
jgi:hypothetical protein